MEPRTLEPPKPWRGRIVVGTDGSPSSAAALRRALDAAEQIDAWLDVVLVWSPDIDFGWLGAPPVHGWLTEPATAGHELVDAVVDQVCHGRRPANVRTFVIEGDPVQCLLTHARGADVLVLGGRGTGGFLGLRLGSVAAACLRHASCPVLIVPSSRDGGTLVSPPGLAPVAADAVPPPGMKVGVFR